MSEENITEIGKFYHLPVRIKIIISLIRLVFGIPIAAVILTAMLLVTTTILVMFVVVSPFLVMWGIVREIWTPPLEKQG